MSRPRAAELALLCNVFVWGATFVLVKSALDDISSILFLVLRFGLATVALGLAFWRPLRRGWNWKAAAAGGLCSTTRLLDSRRSVTGIPRARGRT